MVLIIRIIFVIALFCAVLDAPLDVYVPLAIGHFICLLAALVTKMRRQLPWGEIVALVFFIENSFLSILLYSLRNVPGLSDSIFIGAESYLMVEPEEYLVFGLLSSMALYIGYSFVENKYGYAWQKFITKDIQALNKGKLFNLFVLSQIGTVIQIVGVPGLQQVGYLMAKMFFAVLLVLILRGERVQWQYLVLGLAVLLLTVVRSGMFGDFVYTMAYGVMLYIIRNSIDKKVKTGFYVRSALAIMGGIIFLGLLQNVKGTYRELVWSGQEAASSNLFLEVTKKEAELFDPLALPSYLPIMQRLNQGFLVTTTFPRVPKFEPYANGETISRAFFSALLPRFLYPDKEKAGGDKKMVRFSVYYVPPGTSMNIGLLGESYVNFGKLGAGIFLLVLGFAFGKFEQFVLKIAQNNILFLICFSLLFGEVVGSGTDFLTVFNGLFKAVFFIFLLSQVITKLIPRQQKLNIQNDRSI